MRREGEDIFDLGDGEVVAVLGRPWVGDIHELLFQESNSGSIVLKDNLDVNHVGGGGACTLLPVGTVVWGLGGRVVPGKRV